MRKLFALATVLACAALPAAAQSGAIRLSVTDHNFVSVPQGTTEKYGIQLSNDTDKPFPFSLELRGSTNFVKTSNCPAEVQPGDKCEIIFAYTAPTNSTTWEQADFVVPAQGFNFTPKNLGWLRAHPVPAGQVSFNSPKHNFLYASVGANAAAPFGLIIANGSGKDVPFSLTTSGDTGSFDIASECPETIKANGQCVIRTNFKPQTKGPKKAELIINAGGAQVENNGRVELVGEGK